MPARFSLIWRRKYKIRTRDVDLSALEYWSPEWLPFLCIDPHFEVMSSSPNCAVSRISRGLKFSNVVSRGKQQLSKELLSPEWARDLASYPGQPALGSKFDPPERKLLRWRSLGYQIWRFEDVASQTSLGITWHYSCFWSKDCLGLFGFMVQSWQHVTTIASGQLCEDHRCSGVELVTKTRQDAVVFVSQELSLAPCRSIPNCVAVFLW